MLTLSFSRPVRIAVAPRGAVLLERGGIEPRFVAELSQRAPTPMGRSMLPVFPGYQKYSLCRAKRRRLRTVDNGFLRQPRRAVSAGCQPAIVRQGIRKKRKEETRSPAAPGNAPLPERPI